MLIVQAFKIKNKIGGSTLKFFSYGAPKGAFYIKFGRKTSFFLKSISCITISLKFTDIQKIIILH